MMDVAYQLGLRLPQPPQSTHTAQPEPIEEPVEPPVEPPVEQPNPEDPPVCGELGTEGAGGPEW